MFRHLEPRAAFLRVWWASAAFRPPVYQRCLPAWRRRRSRTPQRSWARTAAGWRWASTQTQLTGARESNQPALTKRCLRHLREGLKQHFVNRIASVCACDCKNLTELDPCEGYSRWWRWSGAQWRPRVAGRGSSRTQTACTAWSAPWGWWCKSRCTESWRRLPGGEARADHLAGRHELMLKLE